MNIIITGASGFLGTALSRFLENRGYHPIKLNSKNCDLRDQKSLERYNDKSYDLIFHLAAWTQAGDFCIYHPGEQWIINQQINTNVLAWWNEAQPQAKLVFMGTSCVYSPDSELQEIDYMVGEPIDSLYTYAYTKRMLYQGARALNKQFGLNYLCAVPSTLYGAGYHTDGRQMHFIFDLIRKIIRGKEFDEKVILWGDGNQKRELVHVNDFVYILWDLCEKFDNEIFNIGAGEEYSIRHFAQLICNHVGYEFSKIEFDTSKYVGAKSKCLNVDKLYNYMPNYSMQPLNDGLSETIQWFYQTKAYNL
jgi:GDP-L-fucose synthase